jgi:hypothetical protein
MKTNESYRQAVALLSRNPRNAEYPTTEPAALVVNLFRVGFDKLFRDLNRYIEKAQKAPTDTESDEFRQWWDREIGD